MGKRRMSVWDRIGSPADIDDDELDSSQMMPVIQFMALCGELGRQKLTTAQAIQKLKDTGLNFTTDEETDLSDLFDDCYNVQANPFHVGSVWALREYGWYTKQECLDSIGITE